VKSPETASLAAAPSETASSEADTFEADPFEADPFETDPFESASSEIDSLEAAVREPCATHQAPVRTSPSSPRFGARQDTGDR